MSHRDLAVALPTRRTEALAIYPMVVAAMAIGWSAPHATGWSVALAALWLGTRLLGELPMALPDGATTRPRHAGRAAFRAGGGGGHGAGKGDGEGDGEHGSDTVEQFLGEHPALVTIGRIGWIAKGVVYGLAGLLAAAVAAGWRRGGSGQPQQEASMSGGIATIAQSRFGAIALALIAIGLLLYAFWRVITVALPADDGTETWLRRLGYAVSAIAYVVLAWTSVTYIRSPGKSGDAGQTQDARVERLTRALLDHSLGRVAVGAVGAAMMAAGVAFAYKGLRRHFKDQLTPGRVGPVSYRALVRLGRAGWVGRGAMMLLIGFFLARAAWRFNPEDAGGLDSALRQAVDHPVGAVLAWVVAAGLILYGLYCVLAAPRKRLAPADE